MLINMVMCDCISVFFLPNHIQTLYLDAMAAYLKISEVQCCQIYRGLKRRKKKKGGVYRALAHKENLPCSA